MIKLFREVVKLRKEQDFFNEVLLEETEDQTSARIMLKNHSLTIKYVKEWCNKYLDKNLLKFLAKVNLKPEQLSRYIIIDVELHEIGHRGTRKYKGCPGTVEIKSKYFIEPLQKATGIENKKILQYLTNLVEDIIDNVIITKVDINEGVTNFIGGFLIYHEFGKFIQRQAQTKAKKENRKLEPNEGQISLLSEGFTRLLCYFCGYQPMKKLMKNYYLDNSYKDKQELNQAIINFLKRTGISEIKTEVMQGNRVVEVRDRVKVREFLMDKENWILISTIFGEEFKKFIKNDQMPKEPLMGSGSSGLSDSGSDSDSDSGGDSGSGSDSEDKNKDSDGDSGKGSNSDDKDSEDKNKDSEDKDKDSDESGKGSGNKDSKKEEDKFTEGDGFSITLEDKRIQKQLVNSALKAGRPGPCWLSNYDYLVALYEVLAADKTIELTLPEMPKSMMPLVDIGKLVFDIEENSMSEIIGVSFDEETKDFELMIAKLKYEVEVKVNKGVGESPDIAIGMLDVSGSMKSAMPKGKPLGKIVNPKADSGQQWNFNCKYHVGLITHFMISELLNELNVFDSDVYFATFSGKTFVSRGNDNSKYEALHPQFRGTHLEITRIQKLLTMFGSMIITISDGDIWNESEVLKAMLEAHKKNVLIHIQIGNDTSYSIALRKDGVCVKNVYSEEDLYYFIINVIQDCFKR